MARMARRRGAAGPTCCTQLPTVWPGVFSDGHHEQSTHTTGVSSRSSPQWQQAAVRLCMRRHCSRVSGTKQPPSESEKRQAEETLCETTAAQHSCNLCCTLRQIATSHDWRGTTVRPVMLPWESV